MELKNESEFELLVGLKSAMGEDLKTIKIDEYKGKYERRIAKKEYINNPAKGITELITSVTQAFGPYDRMTPQQAAKLSIIDRNWILLHLRLITDGELFMYDSVCTVCEKRTPREANLLGLSVIDVDTTEKTIKLDKPYKQGDKTYAKAVIKSATGSCQQDFFVHFNSQNVTGMKIAMLKHCLLSFKGKTKDDVLQPIDHAEFYDNYSPKAVDNIIVGINNLSMDYGPQLAIINKCECGQEDRMELPIANFF